jgi:hypothetical protein
MNKRNKLRNRASALFLVLTPLVLANDAWSNPTIQTRAIALQVIPAPTTTPINRNCLACHTAGQATADVINLKPGYQAAYRLNTTTLTNLKTLLNVLPTTTVGLVNSGVAKTDIYEVICAPGGVSLSSSVKDLAPVKLPFVSTQVTKGTVLSPLSTDPIDGDAIYSVATKLVGAAGAVYSVKINKDAYTGTLATNMGAETYTAQLACRNAANALTGLAWRITQNQ